MKIGVLALQGAAAEHLRMLESVGAQGVAVKSVGQLDDLDGLIIPGGESTTIGKLMKEYGFLEALRSFAARGKAIFGTCAGLIVLAGRIEGQEGHHLGEMDMTVARNAFGRQRESFEAEVAFKGLEQPVQAVFIRAPLIREVGPGVEALAVHGGKIVAARQGSLLVTSFHPELTQDASVHEYFMNMILLADRKGDRRAS